MNWVNETEDFYFSFFSVSGRPIEHGRLFFTPKASLGEQAGRLRYIQHFTPWLCKRLSGGTRARKLFCHPIILPKKVPDSALLVAQFGLQTYSISRRSVTALKTWSGEIDSRAFCASSESREISRAFTELFCTTRNRSVKGPVFSGSVMP